MSSSCFPGLKMKLLSVCVCIYGVYVNRIFASEAQTLLFGLFNCANSCAEEG